MNQEGWLPRSFEDLSAEQAEVQAFTTRDRSLSTYDTVMFKEHEGPWAQRVAFSEFLEDIHGGDLSVRGMVRGMAARKASSSEKVHWADMGSGHATAQRILRSEVEFEDSLLTTSVDLHPLRPEIVTADSSVVQLDRPADLLTAVHHLRYLDNPLAAICNWYNQMGPDGVMLIGHDQDFSDAMHSMQRGDQVPFLRGVLGDLREQGVRSATLAANAKADQEQITTLAIRKTPDTRLTLKAPLARLTATPMGYKTAYYEEPSSGPIVEVS